MRQAEGGATAYALPTADDDSASLSSRSSYVLIDDSASEPFEPVSRHESAPTGALRLPPWDACAEPVLDDAMDVPAMPRIPPPFASDTHAHADAAEALSARIGMRSPLSQPSAPPWDLRPARALADAGHAHARDVLMRAPCAAAAGVGAPPTHELHALPPSLPPRHAQPPPATHQPAVLPRARARSPPCAPFAYPGVGARARAIDDGDDEPDDAGPSLHPAMHARGGWPFDGGGFGAHPQPAPRRAAEEETARGADGGLGAPAGPPTRPSAISAAARADVEALLRLARGEVERVHSADMLLRPLVAPPPPPPPAHAELCRPAAGSAAGVRGRAAAVSELRMHGGASPERTPPPPPPPPPLFSGRAHEVRHCLLPLAMPPPPPPLTQTVESMHAALESGLGAIDGRGAHHAPFGEPGMGVSPLIIRLGHAPPGTGGGRHARSPAGGGLGPDEAAPFDKLGQHRPRNTAATILLWFVIIAVVGGVSMLLQDSLQTMDPRAWARPGQTVRLEEQMARAAQAAALDPPAAAPHSAPPDRALPPPRRHKGPRAARELSPPTASPAAGAPAAAAALALERTQLQMHAAPLVRPMQRLLRVVLWAAPSAAD